MKNIEYNNFSAHFWEMLNKSKNLLSSLPKKTSVTISFDQSKGLEVTSILPEISDMENMLVRLRIFWLNDSEINVKRLLNSLYKLYPEKGPELQQIRDNLKTLDKQSVSIGLKLNGNEYTNIKDIIEYILHGCLLHDDKEKGKHYKVLFQDNLFIREYLYTDILYWIIGYIRYVLFELDLVIKNTVFQENITREQLVIQLTEFVKLENKVN